MKVKKKVKQQSSLSHRALLVNVNISQWAARRLDKEATDTVIKAHKTDITAGGYNKRLLPNAKELADVSAYATEIRKYFYEQTLPWMADGSRIISGQNYLKFATEIRKMSSEFDRRVADFVAAYPRLQAQAQKTLGNLYRAQEYPLPNAIQDKFHCEVNYLPLPDVDDFRVKISDAEKRAFVDKMKETENNAMKDVWGRLHDIVKKAADTLSEPDAIFRDSLLGNLKDMCDLLPALNVSEDPKLEAAKKNIEKLLGGMSPDSLRNDKSVRKDAAKKLKEVTDKMGAFMGGN